MPVVVSDGVLALVAGSDTTASVLSNTFWCLLRHPQAFKRLRAEVDKYYPAGWNALDPVHHPEMAYLESVMYATWRALVHASLKCFTATRLFDCTQLRRVAASELPSQARAAKPWDHSTHLRFRSISIELMDTL